MNRFVLWISLLFAGFSVFAQGENDYLPFFTGYGIKWNGNTFYIDSCISKKPSKQTWLFEGSTSICNRWGNLQLYTDGYNLIDNHHQIIDNGYKGCLANDSCTSMQGSLFLPILDNNIYLFTNSADIVTVLAYSKIDLSNSIVFKNRILQNQHNSEALNAVRHANGRDWWLLAGGLDSVWIYLVGTDTVFYFDKYKLARTDKSYPFLCSFTLSNHGNLMYYSSLSVNEAMCLYSVNRNKFALDSIRDYSYRLYYPGTNLHFWPAYSSVFSPNDSLIINPDYIFSAYEYQVIAKNYTSKYGYMNLTLKNNSVYMMGEYGTLARVIDANKFVLDSTNFTETPMLPYISDSYNRYYMPRVLPNYSLGPDLHPGFTYTQQNCRQVSVTDTSWGHFYRVYDWGDGSPKDTFAVVQHAEYLPGLLDTFKTVTHIYSQPGTYTVQLQILNPYTPYKLPPGQFLKDTTEQVITIPNCISPALHSLDSVQCANSVFSVSYSGSNNYDTLLWSISPNVPFANFGDSISFIAPQIGNYQVVCQAINTYHDTTATIILTATSDCIHPALSVNIDSICADNQPIVVSYTDSVVHELSWTISPNVPFENLGDSIRFYPNQPGDFTVTAQVLAYQHSYNQLVTKIVHIISCPDYLHIFPNPVVI